MGSKRVEHVLEDAHRPNVDGHVVVHVESDLRSGVEESAAFLVRPNKAVFLLIAESEVDNFEVEILVQHDVFYEIHSYLASNRGG